MTTILILEGNPPEKVRAGMADANPFLRCLPALDPTLTLMLAGPYAGPISDELIAQADGVVFTGSGTEWATNAPEAAPQRAAMEQVFAANRPTWGSCNGMQLAAVVLGGDVGASPNGVERGMAVGITLTQDGKNHPMMAGKPSGFGSPCVHRDEVQKLPDGAVLLAGNDHSPVQAMAYAQGGVDFWGVQYHPECSAQDLANWLRSKEKFADMVRDFELAENDPEAAARQGTTPRELALGPRTQELANWLAHVKARDAAA